MVEKIIKKLKKMEWELTLMILPAIIYVFVFSYLPIAGLSMAFQNYSYTKGIFSEFVGLKNFEFLTATGDLYRITKNTIGYNLSSLGNSAKKVNKFTAECDETQGIHDERCTLSRKNAF